MIKAVLALLLQVTVSAALGVLAFGETRLLPPDKVVPVMGWLIIVLVVSPWPFLLQDVQDEPGLAVAAFAIVAVSFVLAAPMTLIFLLGVISESMRH